MYSVLLLAAITSGDSASALHKTGHSHAAGHVHSKWKSTWGSYGAGYGGCYGYGYTGWVGVGGWGHPHASGGAGWGEAYGADAGWGAVYGSYAPAYSSPGGCVSPYSNGPGTGGLPEGPGIVTPPGEASRKVAPGAARVVVNLPEGARLFVDGTEVPRPGTSRNFRTPSLNKGEKYYYDLRAEIIQEGRVVTEKRRVILGAGDTVNADFSNLGKPTGVAAKAP